MRCNFSTGHISSRFCLIALFAASAVVFASAEEKVESPAAPIAEASEFLSQHSGQFNGKSLKYTVRAGETYLHSADGEPKATIFTFDYIKKDVADKSKRPVTFIWNGGPGSSSTWLHMGTFGPKRIVVPSDATHPGSPPFNLTDATETILDVTDLVFIDPVGTGFSRALGTHEGKEFWGLSEDANSMAEFIRDWVTNNGRWNSPRFLLGESFGTTRAASVAKILQGDFQMGVNGIVFVSQALDYAGSTPYVRDNIISHITYVPTMAAAALYHGKIAPKPENQEQFLIDARDFATDELLPALFKGNTLDKRTHDHVRDRLAYFTGLSPDYIERANLRVQGFRFAKELLRDEGLTIGLLDARYTINEVDDLDADPADDAASAAISPAFKSALMSYMHDDLDVKWSRLYLSPADPKLSSSWRWSPLPEGSSWEPHFVNTARDLSTALRLNPQMRVLVASGIYDLVTPFFDAEYTLNRHDIKAKQIEYKYYTGGHMMYVNESARTELLKDTRAFILAQLANGR
ncbi:MAG: carboxypeptidase C (cathepsin A) [Cryomorphaceae bacterium]|jgi:carboxypeptidase C (cathepsin A)